jgi:hypothetical protein
MTIINTKDKTDQLRDDMQTGIRKDWTQIQQECLRKGKEEQRRLCNKMTHSGGNINGDNEKHAVLGTIQVAGPLN